MTTFSHHASRAFDRVQEIVDQISHLREKEAELQCKLEFEQRQADMALLLADVSSILKDVDTRNLSEGKRIRLQGVRTRVLDMMRAA